MSVLPEVARESLETSLIAGAGQRLTNWDLGSSCIIVPYLEYLLSTPFHSFPFQFRTKFQLIQSMKNPRRERYTREIPLKSLRHSRGKIALELCTSHLNTVHIQLRVFIVNRCQINSSWELSAKWHKKNTRKHHMKAYKSTVAAHCFRFL